MKKYVKCDNCGCEIEVGSTVFKMKGKAMLYCSAHCFGYACSDKETLTEDLADDCYKTVFSE